MAARSSKQLTAPMRIQCVLLQEYVGRSAPNMDALLIDLLSKREQPMPFGEPKAWAAPPIPIAKSGCGRYYMCSSGMFEVEEHDEFIMSSHAPWHAYARLGDASISRVDTSVSEDKSMFGRHSSSILKRDTIEWFALGEIDAVRAILTDCHYVGKYRAHGHGHVREWIVERTESWGEGFPVLRDGKPTRPLPLDAPGLAPGHRRAYHVLSPPYWLHEREELVAVP